MKDRRLVNTYSRGLSIAMILRAEEELISSTSAARVVDFPLPVGPDMTIKPAVVSVSRFKSGCRLHARKLFWNELKSRTAIATPRRAWKILNRRRTPETVRETSADPLLKTGCHPPLPSHPR